MLEPGKKLFITKTHWPTLAAILSEADSDTVCSLEMPLWHVTEGGREHRVNLRFSRS